MKRSEMIYLIMNPGPEEGEYYSKVQAEGILEAIEKAGMLPPKFQKLVGIKKNGKSLSYLFDRNGWEPEEDFILDGEKGEL